MRGRALVRKERGATITIVAVSLVAMLSMMALAIDIGYLFKGRNDAQRAADAAALAGASAFRDFPDPNQTSTQTEAHDRAMEYASRNSVLGTPIDTSSEVTVTLFPADRKVRVIIQRASVGLWFAKIFGLNSTSLAAKAAAHVSTATTTTDCVKPVAIRDLWNEVNTTTQDVNADRIWNWDQATQEQWVFDAGSGDSYDPGTTGYGSGWRNGFGTGTANRKDGDYGRRALIMDVDPSNATPTSYYQSWGFLNDSTNEGADTLAWRTLNCDPRGVSLNQEVRALNGGKIGQTTKAWDDLANEDPGLYWDDNTNAPAGTTNAPGGDWTKSSRVMTIMLFSPAEVGTNNSNNFHAANLARFFLEKRACGPKGGVGTCKAPVTARFLGFVPGTGEGPQGSLVMKLQLIE